ncbi:hypothetical protein [Pontibacter chitinilyticus]
MAVWFRLCAALSKFTCIDIKLDSPDKLASDVDKKDVGTTEKQKEAL